MLEKILNTLTPPPTNKKVKVNIFVKILEKRKTLLTHALIKLLKMLKTKRRLSLNHTRKEVWLAHSFKFLSHLAASVNSLAEVNARKMMIEEKGCKSLLEFRREEAEKMQEHKKYVAELYLRMMNHRHSTNPNPFVHNQVSSSFISPSEFTPPMSSSTPPFLPVSRIGALSNRFQYSSTQPLNGKTFPFQFPQINNN